MPMRAQSFHPFGGTHVASNATLPRKESSRQLLVDVIRADVQAPYVRVDTNNVSLAISEEHWLFVDDKMASPATLIPGQILRDAADSAVAVQNVHRKVHLHAPFAYCVDIGTRPAVSGGVLFAGFDLLIAVCD